MTTERPWPAALTDITAGQIRHYRKLRGMTAEELARAVEAVGLKYSRDQVINLERRSRRTTITLSEIVAFGAVLGVPPAMLVMPIGAVDSIEVLPGHQHDTWNSYRWFTGLGADDLLGSDFPPEHEDIPHRLNVYRRYQQALTDLAIAAGDEGDEFRGTSLRLAVNTVVAIRGELRAMEQHLPRLPEDLRSLVEDAEREGPR